MLKKKYAHNTCKKSPRRYELLKKIIKDFDVVPSNVNEEKINEKDPVKFAVCAATLKAKEVAEKYPRSLIVGADTVVVLEDTVFGKPKNYEEAQAMLKALSGTRHKVITALALYAKDTNRLLTDYEVTYVTFRKLTDGDIAQYLKNGDFSDKAGSYAVQTIGDAFVEKIEGDYENVVGLPTRKLNLLLRKFAKQWFRST
jgi:septum formation protein